MARKLAFTKADLFGVSAEVSDESPLAERIMRLGFGKSIPTRTEIDPDAYNTGVNWTKELFSDLIAYFDSESSRFQCVFVSAFGYLKTDRLGVADVLKGVLPGSSNLWLAAARKFRAAQPAR